MATERKYLSLEKLGLYDEKIKKHISDADAVVLQGAKDYADGLADNYDAAGAAASAQSAAEAKAAELVAAEAAIARAAEQANAAAASAADGKAVAAQTAADKAQGEVDALETYVGTIPAEATATDVVGYIVERTSGIATDAALSELTGKVTQAEKDIDAIEADYLKAADKTELAGKITAEENRAKGIEADFETRIAAIEGDYLVEADKTTLQAAIDTKAAQADFAALKEDVDAFFKDADMTESAKDTLKELQAYIAADESGASAMAASIKQNADDIDALEGRMEAAETAIGTKAAQADLEAAVGRIGTLETASATHATITYVDGQIDALELVDADFEERIAAMEAELGEGEGTVAAQIEAAKQAAISAAASDATSKANAAEAAAKGHATELNTAMNTRVEALEAVDHEHANKALLDTYTQTETDLADAVAKKHAHANAGVLDGITADKVTAWDKVADKADQTALQAEIERATAKENAIEAKIDAFVEISEAEINALFTA